MKRKVSFLVALLLCLALLCACGQPSEERPAAYPLEPLEGELDYPEAPAFAEPEIPEPIGDLDTLALAVDTAIYRSLETGAEMVYYHLTDELRKQALRDPSAFVGKALQIALLGHTFYQTYDDSRLAEGYLGLRCGFPESFATVSTEPEEGSQVLSYEFYKNTLQTAALRQLSFSQLPICQNTDRYLSVENSEQLVYAVEYGYLPYCTEGSSAEKILRRAIGILSQITREDMSETEIYTAIYQYVILSNQYDYNTLLDSRVQDPGNRVFFLEGAVLDGRAVCDGMSKELVLLARLMGLEAYHIGARNGDGGHAYVYVKLDGSWYLSCPTYGSQLYSRKDGLRQDYHTNNYMLTDFDTNMQGWDYDSDAFEQIEAELRTTKPYDYWRETTVEIGGQNYSFHPETVEEALAVLEDALALHQQLGIPVEVELCGKVDVLREAYARLKEQSGDVVYLSGGTFEQQRLQVYLIGAKA